MTEDPIGHSAKTQPSEPLNVGWIWLVYAALYAIAIPWYWPANFRGPLVLGLPLWTVVTLLSVFALACWTAVVIWKFWRAEED